MVIEKNLATILKVEESKQITTKLRAFRRKFIISVLDFKHLFKNAAKNTKLEADVFRFDSLQMQESWKFKQSRHFWQEIQNSVLSTQLNA